MIKCFVQLGMGGLDWPQKDQLGPKLTRDVAVASSELASREDALDPGVKCQRLKLFSEGEVIRKP